MNHFTLKRRQTGQILNHDGSNFRRAIGSFGLISKIVGVDPLHLWIEVNGIVLAVFGLLHALATEGLENGAAGVGGEFESTRNVEFVNGPKQSHIALTQHVGKLHVFGSGSFGHGHDERHIDLGNFMTKLHGPRVPIENLSSLGWSRTTPVQRAKQFGDAEPAVVEPQENHPLLGRGQHQMFAGVLFASVGGQ